MRAADSLGKERRLPDHSKERLVAGERAVEHLPQERIALDRLAPELEISGILRAETSPIRTQIADLAVPSASSTISAAQRPESSA
jgi:hypothetical protein